MARYRFFFWLDADKDDELLLCEDIDALKKKRAFTAAVRDGLRLVVTLSQGDTSFLQARFPMLVKRLVEAHYPTRELEELRTELRELRERVGMAAVQPAGLKPLSNERMVLPLLEDEDDGSTLVLKKDTRTNASQNLIDQLMGMF